MKSAAYFQGTGRRKTAIARVRLVPGEGTVVVNGKQLDDYFGIDGAVERATAAFGVTNTVRKFNAMIKVEGGGVTGQIGAIAHGIARALLQVDKENTKALRQAGLLTRDPRAKERKKPGLKRARKAPTVHHRTPFSLYGARPLVRTSTPYPATQPDDHLSPRAHSARLATARSGPIRASAASGESAGVARHDRSDVSISSRPAVADVRGQR